MNTHSAGTFEQKNYQFQKIIVAVGLLLFFVKITAWFLTHSVAIYSDALESIVNIISSFIGLYSLYLTRKPKDQNHPYGHGKIEFISSGIEGVLIAIAGIVILIEAIQNLFVQNKIEQIDYGIALVLFSALANFSLGYIAIRQGKKYQSLVLQSSGKHLLSDTWSTLGIVIGLILIYFTKTAWIDSCVAIVFSFVILYTAYKIIRDSVSGIMDEADEKLITEIVAFLESKRISSWIDLHNLRIIKYGPKLHMDLHLTLPYYMSVLEAHNEMEAIDRLVNSYFGDRVEVFIHTDPCQEFSCKICSISSCEVRKSPLVRQVEWNLKNVSQNNKHRLE